MDDGDSGDKTEDDSTMNRDEGEYSHVFDENIQKLQVYRDATIICLPNSFNMYIDYIMTILPSIMNLSNNIQHGGVNMSDACTGQLPLSMGLPPLPWLQGLALMY